MAQHPSQNTSQRLMSPGGQNNASSAVNFRDSAQNIAGTHSRIILRHGIATRNPLRTILADQPMDNDAALPLH